MFISVTLSFSRIRQADTIIVNEVTGNWYQTIGGCGKRYAYKAPCTELPCFGSDPRDPSQSV